MRSGERIAEIDIECQQWLFDGGMEHLGDCTTPSVDQWELEFSADGSLLAMADGHDFAMVWDAATGEVVFEQPQPAGAPSTVALSPDGRHLVVDDFRLAV